MDRVRRRTHKARLYPTSGQTAALDRQRNTARALWNLLHEWYTCRRGGIARRPSIVEIDRQLRDARVNPLPGWEWLADLPAQATQQVLKHYLNAWNRYSSGVSKPPTFKKRNARMAIDAPQASALKIARLNRHWGEVRILLVGRVPFRWTRPLPRVSRDCPGRITGARLVRDQLGWYICFRIEEPAVVAPSNAGPPVGVDHGVIHTMALSNGEMLDMRSLLTPGEERRLRGLERKAARQQLANKYQRASDPTAPISKRQSRTYRQIAALRARQARRREDWLHKITTDLAKSHSGSSWNACTSRTSPAQPAARSSTPAAASGPRRHSTVRSSAWPGAKRDACSPTSAPCMVRFWFGSTHGTPRSNAPDAGTPRLITGSTRRRSAVWLAGNRRTPTPTPLRYYSSVDSSP